MVQSKKEKAADKVLTLLFILLALFCVVPILYILSASLSDEIQLTKEGYSLLPRGFSQRLWGDDPGHPGRNGCQPSGHHHAGLCDRQKGF